MDYEYLLRRAYQCGRSYDKGISADLYRRLDHRHKRLKTKQSNLSITSAEAEHDYTTILNDITARVYEAIEVSLQRFEPSLLEEQRLELTQLKEQLDGATFERLEDIIRRADAILGQARIYPGQETPPINIKPTFNEFSFYIFSRRYSPIKTRRPKYGRS